MVTRSATTILLLHGFTNTGASWKGVAAGLGERYRPLAPDLRGHGSAGAARPVSLAAVIDDLSALAPGELTVCGYSMGGRIALHVALALTGRVSRLVLIGASPGIADPAQRSARRRADERLADELEGMTISAFAQRWARTPVLAGQPPAVRALVDADRRRNTTAGLAAALRGLGTGALPSLWGRLGELTMPVDLIVGERDAKFRATAEAMAAGLPRARVMTVAGAGHAVHLEDPDAVTRILDAGSAGAAGLAGPAGPASRTGPAGH